MKISFTHIDFIEFIDSFKSSTVFYNTVTELSKTRRGTPLVDNSFMNNFKMLSLDEIVDKKLVVQIPPIILCGKCSDSKCKKNFQFSSTDAFYVSPSSPTKLYFIEFKKKDIFDPNQLIPQKLEKNLSKLITKLETIKHRLNFSIDPVLGDQNEIDKHIMYVKESLKESRKFQSNSLKLKSLESLSCIIPWAYELYCLENEISIDMVSFKTFLMGCRKEYIIVHEDSCQPHSRNPSSNRIGAYKMRKKCEEDPYGEQRLSYHPFDEVWIANPIEFTRFIQTIS